jgi:hypothetical protein
MLCVPQEDSSKSKSYDLWMEEYLEVDLKDVIKLK